MSSMFCKEKRKQTSIKHVEFSIFLEYLLWRIFHLLKVTQVQFKIPLKQANEIVGKCDSGECDNHISPNAHQQSIERGFEKPLTPFIKCQRGILPPLPLSLPRIF